MDQIWNWQNVLFVPSHCLSLFVYFSTYNFIPLGTRNRPSFHLFECYTVGHENRFFNAKSHLLFVLVRHYRMRLSSGGIHVPSSCSSLYSHFLAHSSLPISRWKIYVKKNLDKLKHTRMSDRAKKNRFMRSVFQKMEHVLLFALIIVLTLWHPI